METAVREVRRIPPIAVGRAFHAALGRRFPVSERQPSRRAFRAEVDSLLITDFGVPLPAALDWLAAAACRRMVPAEEVAAFLGHLFDLEPLNRPATVPR